MLNEPARMRVGMGEFAPVERNMLNEPARMCVSADEFAPVEWNALMRRGAAARIGIPDRLPVERKRGKACETASGARCGGCA